MATRDDVSKVIMVLAASFPNFKAGRTASERKARLSEMIGAYTAILGDLDADRLARAAYHLASMNTFFPSAAELRAAYFSMEERATGVPSADEAWGEVKRLFHRGYSRYRAPPPDAFSHPLVQKALEGIGGWLALCDSENDAADRARFLQAYEIHVRRDRELSRMLPAVRETIEQLAGHYRRALADGKQHEAGPARDIAS